MIDIRDNTVPADRQMICSSDLSFLGREGAPLRVLVVGNSITRHGPNEAIGWPYDWGMAASAPERDYVHRLYARLTEAGYDVHMRIRQCSFWERNFMQDDVLEAYSDERDFAPHVIVYRLGENVPRELCDVYGEKVKSFTDHLSARGGHTVFTTCFWAYEGFDEQVVELARRQGDVLVDLRPLAKDERTMALGLFEHKGVSMHPGDYGMDEISRLVFEAIDGLLGGSR